MSSPQILLLIVAGVIALATLVAGVVMSYRSQDPKSRFNKREYGQRASLIIAGIASLDILIATLSLGYGILSLVIPFQFITHCIKHRHDP